MQLTVRMPDEYEALLDHLSKEMALKRSDIVRIALKHLFEEHQESAVQTPFQRVRHLLGVGKSGVRDLGKNHRAYLAKAMESDKITFKGQVTIPKKVRTALGIQPGDSVLFSVEGGKAVLEPFKNKSLLDFYGSMPVKRKYPGSDAIRREVHQKIAKAIVGKMEE
jgi:antitoxin PrlF